MSDIVVADIVPEVTPQRGLTLARLRIVQAQSKELVEAGGKPGQIAVLYEENISFFNELPVWLVDIIPSRVMFPYRPNGQKDLTSNEPWCASSDGVTPRSEYIGLQYKDWRNGLVVTIQENGCDTCPLGQWTVVEVDKNGDVVFESDGKPMLKRYAKGEIPRPPCSKSSQAVLLVLFGSSVVPASFQASSPSIRNYIDGNRRERIRGLASYFSSTLVNGERTLPFMHNGQPYPLMFATQITTHTAYNSISYVPLFYYNFENGVPFTQEQYDAVRAAMAAYKNEQWRSVLMGMGQQESALDDGRARTLLSGGSGKLPVDDPVQGDDPF